MTPKYILDIRLCETGWPDIGHYEYFLISVTDRRFKFLQKILGPKTEELVSYGEDKPTEARVKKDIAEIKKLQRNKTNV